MNVPRILFTAPASNMGKTTVTCGFLAILRKKYDNIVCFKCGPDYIDTLFHSEVIGVPSYNIDSFLMGEQCAKTLFCQNAYQKQFAVLEGVMGYYDGLAGVSTKASTYDIAKLTQTPVILVINAKGMSVSVVAMIKGFLEYQKDSNIKGVILNGITEMLYTKLKQVIEKELPIKVYGYLPQKEEFHIQSRHLGLVTPCDIENLKQKIDILGQEMQKTVDICAILELAQSAEPLQYQPVKNIIQKQRCHIAVAKDNAFCFYYQDNIQYLQQNGCYIRYFSPLKDKKLPENIDGLLLGGGYPELYAKELSENTSMLASIRQQIKDGLPVIAECGGFLYLHKTLQYEQKEYAMLGIINAKAYKTNKLKQFGYVTLCAKKDTMLCKKGECINAHEFHYCQSTDAGNDFEAKKPLSDRSWNTIHSSETIFAGFPHIHFYGNTHFADNFIQKCIERGHNKKR